MDASVVVCGGVDDAFVVSCLRQVWANGGEGGGGVVEGRCEHSARVSDREGDKLHSSPILLEGLDEGGIFIGLLCELNVAAEVSAEADLDYGDGALFLGEGGRVGRGEVWNPPSID